MNCLRKNIARIETLLVATVLLFSFSSVVKADYSSISLSPSSGTIYSDSTPVTILINSGTDEFVGIDAYLSFTGAVEYVSATGADRCDSFQVVENSGVLNIECFSISHPAGQAYNGTLATLYFKSTATGTSTFTITETDPATTTKSGGTYTLSLNSSLSHTFTHEIDPITDTLPDSGIFDDSRSVFIFGFLVMLSGLLFNQIMTKTPILLGKVTETVQKRTIDKRRKKLEKRF